MDSDSAFRLSGVYTAIIESSQPALASMLIAEHQHGTGFGLMSTVDGVGDFLSSVTMACFGLRYHPTQVSPQPQSWRVYQRFYWRRCGSPGSGVLRKQGLMVLSCQRHER